MEVSTEVVLVRLDKSHVDVVMGIARVSFPDAWSEKDYAYFLSHPCSHSFGVKVGERIVGYILGLLVQGVLDIISIATHPELRRKGHADILMQSVCSTKGLERITLEVEIDNISAIELYKKHGFSIMNVRKLYYAQRRDAYLMMRSFS